jgi:hypothetical protein
LKKKKRKERKGNRFSGDFFGNLLVLGRECKAPGRNGIGKGREMSHPLRSSCSTYLFHGSSFQDTNVWV